MKTHPDRRIGLSFDARYSATEFESIKRGFLPERMEEKWFILYEEPWLHFYRSWTGFCIYGVRFEATPRGASTVETWVSRDVAQYGGTDARKDEDTLRCLIDFLLLEKSPEDRQGLEQSLADHVVIGRVPAPPRPHERRSLWRRLRDRLR